MLATTVPAYAGDPDFSPLALALLFPSGKLSLTSASANPSSVEQGKSVTFTVTYKASAALSGVLVDLELRSQKNLAKIAQKVYSNQSFAKNESRTFTFTAPISSAQALGKYSLVALTLDKTLRAFSVSLNAVAITVVKPVEQPPVNPNSYIGVNIAAGEAGGVNGVYGEDYIYPQASDMDYFKSKGLTLVRVPFLWEKLQPVLNGPLNEDELQHLRETTALAAERSMRVIFLPWNFGKYNGLQIGSADVPVSAYVDFLQKFATAFRDDSAMYAYDLMQEPEGFNGSWPAIAQAGLNAVRSVDNAKLILVQGECGSLGESFAQCNSGLNIVDSSNNFAYEAHQSFSADGQDTYSQSYDVQGAYPQISVDKLTPFRNFIQSRNARGYIGEFSIPNDDPRWQPVLTNALQFMKDNCMLGTYYTAGVTTANLRISIQPINGADKPQTSLLTPFTTNTTCSNF